MELRPGIDYPGTGIGVVLLDPQKRVFVAHRGPEARNEPDTWEIPGGTVEFGHTLEDTAIREMEEEYSISIGIVKKLDFFNHIIPATNDRPLEHWTSVLFQGQIVSGTPRIMEPEKCIGLDWLSLSELMKRRMSSITELNLKSILQNCPDLICLR